MDIQTVSTRYAIRRLRTKSIDLEEYGAAIDTWLHDLFRWIAKKSIDNRMHHTELEVLLKGLKLLASDDAWKLLIRQQPRSIRIDDLLSVYRRLEENILELSYSFVRSRQIFDSTRRHVKRYLEQRPDCPQAVLLRSFFFHKRFSFSKARGLISDQSLSGPGENQEPIGALPHSTALELEQKIRKKLDGDLREIQNACATEINAQLKYFEWLRQIGLESRNIKLKEEWDKLVGRTQDVWCRAMQQFSERDLLREFLLRHEEAPTFRPSLFAAYVDQARILKYVSSELGEIAPKRLSSLIRTPHMLSSDLLLNFLILLQIHTCWNVSSLLELTADFIKTEGGAYSIQGFKSKTNSRTPIIWILPSDGVVFKCVDMLLSRLAYLKKSGRVSPVETRAWIASRRSNNLNTQVLGGWGQSRRKLIKKYNLPEFSFEQIRVQCLAKVYMSEGGLEAARRSADHSSIRTTAHYLDQLLLNRVNSAKNLEFQRRLERNVGFRIDERETWSPNADEDMLYPIGDGTSCIKPDAPPHTSWLQDGLCMAERCHADGGCPNNKLLLDIQRIEEIALTTRFYEGNWQRLASQNMDAFREKHLPAMLFNIALNGFVSKGPYGHLLRRFEAGACDA